ncbi:MAG: patatin-like phospholipase family protein [Verrucomicrobia bacterium]|nr:patatin-like phospholipase family protein [Verrucomicrobiota bacterium]
MSSPRFAITLGASFLGYATHAGFLARLHELGIRPARVGGSSAGAIAAGLYAAGLTQEKIRDVVTSWSFRQSFIRHTPWLRQFIANTFRTPYPAPFKSTATVDYLEALFGDLQIEDLIDPSFMTADTDIDHRQAHFLQTGSLAKAIVASTCVPTIFSPLNHASMMCSIIVHRIHHTTHDFPKFIPLNLFKLTAEAHGCASEQLLQYRLKLAAMHGKKVIITDTTHDRPALFSGKRMPDFYEAGQEQAQRFYDSVLKQMVEG